MRVLLVSNLFPPNVVGGAEIMMHALAEGLLAKGLEVGVASLAEGAADSRQESSGLKVWFLEAHPMGNLMLQPNRTAWRKVAWHLIGEINPKAPRSLSALIGEFEPDLVHSSNLTGLGTGIWGACRQLGLPIVHSLQDYGLLCIRGTMFKGDRRCLAQCPECRLATSRRRWASNGVDAVVGISQFVLNRHLDAGYFAKAAERRVILTDHTSGDAPPRRARGSEEPIRLGYLGRLHHTKGIETLLDACHALPKEGWRLSVAGRGSDDYLSALKTRGAGLPVDWLPWTRPEDFFASTDLLVVPSLWDEPLGMTIIEAGFWGLPVLAPKRGGAPELIEAGISGMTFDPENPSELAGILNGLLGDRQSWEKLAQGAAAAPRSGGRERMAAAYIDLYSALAPQAAQTAQGAPRTKSMAER